MGLFPSANDFKAGKGVEKDAPRKTGVRRFFELVGRDMNSMFLANLLTCLGFVPVISLVYIGFLMNNLPVMLISAAVGGILAGPVLAGMYDTVLRALRDEAGYWWVTYRKAFKRNFKASILPGVLYCVVVTLQIFLVYFCFNMLYHGTNVGVPLWVATVLNLLIFQMLFSYMWPQIALLDQPLSLTLKNSINCMIAFLPHALAASIVQLLFWAAHARVRRLVRHRGVLSDRVRRPGPGVPHRGEHPQAEGCRAGSCPPRGLRRRGGRYRGMIPPVLRAERRLAG